jgi:DNA-binding transcriptional ArsR family regulator
MQERQLKKNPAPESGSLTGFRDIAFVAKALADENRLRIIVALTQGKKSVSRIVEELGISQPLASHHLKELKRALLVSVERSGPFIYYELADRRIATIITDLNGLATDLLANRTAF